MYAYLDSIKVLENGTAIDIAQAKKDYYRIYKSQWRKNDRKHSKVFEILLKDDEYTEIAMAAKAHKLSKTRFIKTAALAYLDKRFIVPDMHSIGVIRQLLALNYSTLQSLFEENKLPFEIGRDLLRQMATLENSILSSLVNPMTLEQLIEIALKKDSEFRNRIVNLINSVISDH